jgi:tetratricopeptide (TPR) repeat protein
MGQMVNTIDHENSLKILWREMLRVFPKCTLQDFINALTSACWVEQEIIGRHCGGIANKVAQYLAIAQLIHSSECKFVKCVEIGTLFGGSCLMKLFALRDLQAEGKVICIDPMAGYYQQESDIVTGLPVNSETFFHNIAKFGFFSNQVELRQTFSNDPVAVAGIEEGTIVSLMIDGDHSYQGVKDDWERFNRFVAAEGIVLFDDFSEPNWPDITKFIDELAGNLPLGWMMVGTIGTTAVVRLASPLVANTDTAIEFGASAEKSGSHIVSLAVESFSRRGISIKALWKHMADHIQECSLMLLNRAIVYRKLGEWNKVGACLDACELDHGDSPLKFFNLLVDLAKNSLNDGKLAEAEKRLLQVTKIKNMPVNMRFGALCDLCNIYRESGNHEKIIRVIDDIFEEFPEDKKFYLLLRLGDSFSVMKLFKEAIFNLQKAVNLPISKEMPLQIRFNSLRDLSNLYLLIGDHDKVISLLNDEFKEFQADKKFFLFSRRGDSLLAMSRFKEAIDCFTNALDLPIDDEKSKADLILKIGLCLGKEGYNSTEEKLYCKGLRFNNLPSITIFRLLFRLSRCLHKRNEIDKALSSITTALDLKNVPEKDRVVALSLLKEIENDVSMPYASTLK